ncbi:hypothetical protein JK635_07575 [Neobacillus sp. YIM B02564]|uniref:PH domain-containing protein n=1 Tax=Neobacillus paridis TaxID=2803862 RepID=A0ABS1TLK0_9BACI|nr:STM3941 family protein [Neobacillus paridis]MBL4952068.1 hypothetical protein [Neobacillus paridis]
MQNEVAFHRKRGKAFLLALDSLFFVAFGFFVSLLDPSLFFLGIPWIIFFGITFFYFLSRFIKPAPILILNTDGFIDRSSLISGGFIPWEDISFVFPTKLRGQDFLWITLKDPESFIQQHPPLKRKVLHLVWRKHGTPLLIPAYLIAAKEETILKAFQPFAKTAF